jgi:hypothetical protein
MRSRTPAAASRPHKHAETCELVHWLADQERLQSPAEGERGSNNRVARRSDTATVMFTIAARKTHTGAALDNPEDRGPRHPDRRPARRMGCATGGGPQPRACRRTAGSGPGVSPSAVRATPEAANAKPAHGATVTASASLPGARRARSAIARCYRADPATFEESPTAVSSDTRWSDGTTAEGCA